MNLRAWLIRGAPAILLCASLNGCVPSGQSDLEEAKEPHFLEGKSCMSSMDYKGAIEKFAQALEANPRHASAHFELGCIYEERDPDPAAAIYHYEQFLKLRPNDEKVEFVRQRIMNCKQDLAKTVLLPVSPAPALQRQFEQLADENKRLRDEVDQWKAAYYAALTNGLSPGLPVAPTAVAIRPLVAPADPAPANPASGTRPVTPARTHIVQAGDSPYGIARKYGIKLEALMAANPGLEPKRMQVGRTLVIPAP